MTSGREGARLFANETILYEQESVVRNYNSRDEEQQSYFGHQSSKKWINKQNRDIYNTMNHKIVNHSDVDDVVLACYKGVFDTSGCWQVSLSGWEHGSLVDGKRCS